MILAHSRGSVPECASVADGEVKFLCAGLPPAVRFGFTWERGLYMQNDLMNYSVQLAILSELMARKLISLKEYELLKHDLMNTFHIVSDLSA